MSAQEHFREGRLAEAVEAALASVKKQPTDLNNRFFLAELLCFQGEWERADRQLDTIIKQPANKTLLAQLMRQLIRGEVARQQVFSEGRPPELAVPLPVDAQVQLELCAAMRLGQKDDWAGLCEKGLEAQATVRGKCNDKAFEGLQDLDDRVRGTLEAITASGKYYWMPWASIISLSFAPAERPMDLIWRKAQVNVQGGPHGEVYVPVRYPLLNAQAWSDAQRLGRETAWEGDEASATTGIGQRMLLVGEEALTIMEIQALTTDIAAEGEPPSLTVDLVTRLQGDA